MEENRYKKLASNTVLFAISSFSGKLLTLLIQPFITYAMREVEEVGITKLTSQCANLLIPLVGLGISYAVLRFGLDKNYSRRQVYTCGLAAVFGGFILMLLFYPLLKLVPIFTDYAVYLYIYVLMSCLRTLTSQLVRCRQLNRLVAVDGILCSAATLLYNVIFLLGFDLGAKGYLLAIICGDATSTVFMFIVGNVAHYVDFSRFNKKLLVQMLRYSIPLIPAQISFWVINASDLFFVKGLLGESGNYWSGLLGTGYFLPTILVTLGTIFYEAWQLSAVTEQKGREAFFSKVFYIYQCVMFSCGGHHLAVPAADAHFPRELLHRLAVCSGADHSYGVQLLQPVFEQHLHGGKAQHAGAVHHAHRRGDQLRAELLLHPALGQHGRDLRQPHQLYGGVYSAVHQHPRAAAGGVLSAAHRHQPGAADFGDRGDFGPGQVLGGHRHGADGGGVPVQRARHRGHGAASAPEGEKAPGGVKAAR